MVDDATIDELYEIMRRDDADAMDKLIRDGLDVLEPTFNRNYPAMHWAAACNAVNVMEKLMEHGIECDMPARFGGVTPLIMATTNCATEAALFLLEHGASPNTADNYGHSAIQSAVYDGMDEEMAVTLLEAGASVYYPLYRPHSRIEIMLTDFPNLKRWPVVLPLQVLCLQKVHYARVKPDVPEWFPPLLLEWPDPEEYIAPRECKRSHSDSQPLESRKKQK